METQKLLEVKRVAKMTVGPIGFGSLEENSEVSSQYQQFVIQPSTYGLALVRSGVTFPGKKVLENAIEDYSQQLSDLQNQMRETHKIHEEQKFIFRQSIINLQNKLQEVHIEKDALSDLRMKESRKQTKVMGKMQAVIRELKATKHAGHQRLLEAEAEAKSQCRRAESLERTIQEVYSTLSAYDKRTGSCSFTVQEALGDAVERLLQDLEHEIHSPREGLRQVEGKMNTLKWPGKAEILLKGTRERKNNERQISVYNGQEVALSILRSDLLDAQQRHEDKASLERREVRVSLLEQESPPQRAGLSEQSHRVEELPLETQQLTAELELQRSQLHRLTEEYEDVKKLQGIKRKDQQGVVVSLKAQLKTTRAGLDQARITLRTLEGADGHGLKVAKGMLKQITDGRDQVDTLQGQIQILQETLDKLNKEKHYQSLENECQNQELASVTEEKRQLAAEVETMRSLEKRLQERVAKLENGLHKMSESFVNCQDFIQLQEQEFVRLKLQHALDMKELQGQHWRTTGKALYSTPSGPTCPRSLPSTQHSVNSHVQLKPQQLLESSTVELKSLVTELQGVTSVSGPHTINGTKSILGRSAPGREHRTTLTTDRDKQNLNSNFLSRSHDFSLAASLPCYTSSPRALALGRRSPVHSLLTSDPNPTP